MLSLLVRRTSIALLRPIYVDHEHEKWCSILSTIREERVALQHAVRVSYYKLGEKSTCIKPEKLDNAEPYADKDEGTHRGGGRRE